MDRFFSKLDLRDIKIDPVHTSFSPDEPEEIQDEIVADAFDEATLDDPATSVADSPAWTDEDEELPVDGNRREQNGRTSSNHDGSDVLKVSSKSRPSAVAGAIAGVVREAGRAEVQAIGAGATNQAIKAVAIARDYLLETGIDAVCLPAFIDITIDNEDRTAIRLVIEPR